MNIDKIRDQFEATQKWIYMDVANQSIISKSIRNAIDEYTDDIQKNGGTTEDQWFGKIEEARKKFAKLINANLDEIAFTKNTSEGLNIIANAFPWEKGDNVVLCGDIEHPNNIYVWYNLQRLGVEVRFISSRKGFVTPEDFIENVDKNTRMISVSSVSFVPGQRIDLKRLAHFCRDNNIFLLVDASQSCGILDINIKELPIDAIVVPTYKGLLGLYGMGFLFCREDWIQNLHPVYLARYSIGSGKNSHESAIEGPEYQLHQSAKRFEIGHYNIVGIFAVDSSLEFLLSKGVKNIEQHVLQLSRRFTKGLENLDMIVSSGRDDDNLSNIVTIGEWGKGDHYNTDDPKIAKLFDYLKSKKVKLSLRRGLIRFSLHLYNTPGEVDHILNLIDLKASTFGN